MNRRTSRLPPRREGHGGTSLDGFGIARVGVPVTQAAIGRLDSR